jgi:DNA-binding Lrp family transcriptional regulator
MSYDELIFFSAVLLFSVTALLSASTFYNRLNRAKEEEIDLVKAILHPINKQQKTVESGLSRALYEIDRVTAQVAIVENEIERIKHQTQDPGKTEYLTLENGTKDLAKQIAQLQDDQKALHAQIKAIATRPLQKKRSERGPKPVQSTTLTKTEKQILEALNTDGPKTAPEIEGIVQKTREHTSRLMKKLWLEGYIEREVHVIPYVYRPTKKLVERVSDVR